jgi:hypothetical protein
MTTKKLKVTKSGGFTRYNCGITDIEIMDLDDCEDDNNIYLDFNNSDVYITQEECEQLYEILCEMRKDKRI